jgi:hypothetical protein
MDEMRAVGIATFSVSILPCGINNCQPLVGTQQVRTGSRLLFRAPPASRAELACNERKAAKPERDPQTAYEAKHLIQSLPVRRRRWLACMSRHSRAKCPKGEITIAALGRITGQKVNRWTVSEPAQANSSGDMREFDSLINK